MKMDQNARVEGDASAQGAFERFKERIRKLSGRQNGVFADIMQRIDKRKLEAARRNMDKVQTEDR